MLTKTDLFSYDVFPALNDISLELYRDFSESVLLKRTFEYLFDDSSTAVLQFTESGIYHMLGIHHIDRNISSTKFFNAIKNGLSFSNFCSNSAMNQRFKSMKPRLRIFACVYQTLRLGEVFYCPSGMVNNTKSVNMDYIIYRKVPDKGLNIGIRKDKQSKVYIPLTVLVSKAIKPDIYIDKRNIKTVRSLKIKDEYNNTLETIVHSNSFITLLN